jgi:hypothetical protein
MAEDRPCVRRRGNNDRVRRGSVDLEGIADAREAQGGQHPSEQIALVQLLGPVGHQSRVAKP